MKPSGYEHTCENRDYCFVDRLDFLMLEQVADEKRHNQEHDQDEKRP